MHWRAFRNILRRLLNRNVVESELDEEIQTYLQEGIEERIASGMPPEEARRRSVLDLGGTEQVKEVIRDRRRLAWIDGIVADVHHALRVFRKRRSFTMVAILTMGLGIASSAAVFSIVDKVMLKPLPYKEATRLVSVLATVPKWRSEPTMARFWDQFTISYVQYQELAKPALPFEDIAVFHASDNGTAVLITPDAPQRISVGVAPAKLFSLLGVSALRGRLFLPDDEKSDATDSILLSATFWRREFAEDPAVVGQHIDLDQPSATLSMSAGTQNEHKSYLILGVLPENFTLTGVGMDSGRAPEVWLPLRPSARGFNPNAPDFEAIGRLKTGVTIARAEEITGQVLTGSMDRGFAASTGIREEGAHIADRRLEESGNFRTPLLLLFSASGILLLIAFSNVANLFLGEAMVRRHEIALRAAIGATRARITRQLVTESLLLSVGAATFGAVIASWSVHGVLKLLPAGMPHADEVHLDIRVLLFVVCISIFAGLLFGVGPSLLMPRSSLMDVLKNSGAKHVSDGGSRWPAVLTIAEVALSIVLLVGAGLLGRSLLNVSHVTPGVRPDSLLTVEFRLNPVRYAMRSQRSTFYNQLSSRLKSLPGVEDVSEIGQGPFNGKRAITAIDIEGQQPKSVTERILIERRDVQPNYFAVSGTRIIEGRPFNESDVPASIDENSVIDLYRAAIVSRSMAQRFWGNENVVGKRFHFGQQLPKGFWVTIVGVTEDVQFFGLRNGPVDIFYMPNRVPEADMTVLIRTRVAPLAVASAVRNELHQIDPSLPIDHEDTMEQLISSSTATERYRALLIMMFALSAVALALVGLYAVLSRFVSYRTRELGIRIALGARNTDVLSMVLRRSVKLTSAGIAIGLAAALGASRLLSDLLFGVSSTDVTTYILISAGLAITALLASYVPARRASQVDPIVVLRQE